LRLLKVFPAPPLNIRKQHKVALKDVLQQRFQLIIFPIEPGRRLFRDLGIRIRALVTGEKSHYSLWLTLANDGSGKL